MMNFRFKISRVFLGATLLAGSPLVSPAQQQIDFTYDQLGYLEERAFGVAAADEDYVVTHVDSWTILPKDFAGDFMELPGYSNANAKDAATGPDGYMFQLRTVNFLSKIRMGDGEVVPINGEHSIYLGIQAFGIGYDASTNTLGIGRFYSGETQDEVGFLTYDLTAGVFSEEVRFPFDIASYGRPWGLDYVVVDGHPRYILANWAAAANHDSYVVEMDPFTGSVEQYIRLGRWPGIARDVLYEDGRLAISFAAGSEGVIMVGDYTVIPEPRTYAAILGLLAVAFSLIIRVRRRRNQRFDV